MKEVTTLIGAAVHILEEAAKIENKENFLIMLRRFPLNLCPDTIIEEELKRGEEFLDINKVLTLQQELRRRKNLGIRIEEIKEVK